MERLIPILNQLLHVHGVVGGSSIKLPELVVVGSQSSGKSSVLENIVGRDFLPRGNNMVTRRPLVLQLLNTGSASGAAGVAAGASAGAGRPGEAERKGSVSIDGKRQMPALPVPRPHGQPLPAAGAAPSPMTQSHSQQQLQQGAVVEWGEFSHLPGRQFTKFADIKAEINQETDRGAGSGNTVSPDPIYLKIYSPSFLNLTLVDLPGITKVATRDQPVDIELQIRKMILDRISNPHSIIVAVSAANEDIVNSEALKIAKEVDPTFSRTVGVLTKLDLMDQGTDAMKIFQNEIIPLRFGYVGVVSRSQKDIQDSKPLQHSLEAERRFFLNGPYASIADQMGTAYLVRKLSALLLGHLQRYLPELRQRVTGWLSLAEKELTTYGDPFGLDELGIGYGSGALVADYELTANGTLMPGAAGGDVASGSGKAGVNGSAAAASAAAAGKSSVLGPIILNLLAKYASHFNDLLDGRSKEMTADQAIPQQLYGGARINYVFHDLFGAHIDGIDPLSLLSDVDIRTAIRNSAGPRPSLFLPEASFELLVKKQIERLRAPALECVDMVAEELQRVAHQCEVGSLPILTRFPNLRESLLGCVHDVLEKRLVPTRHMVQNIVNVELAYINTNHPDFVSGGKVLTQLGKARVAQAVATTNGAPGAAAAAGGAGAAPGVALAATAVKASTPGGSLQRSGSNANLGGSGTSASVSSATVVAAAPVGSSGWGLGDIPLRGASGSGFAAADDPSLDEVSAAFRVKPPTERELIEIEVVKQLISNYFAIVKKTIKDIVPKTIMFLLINKTKQSIQTELVNRLYKEDQFASLLKEADGIADKRDACQKRIAMLRQLFDILNQLNDLAL